ncbi:hypothetical protein [Kitasatospora sp. NPDC015120]|uniref:hypothetical protein n=1 Tax=Kitasatospora sp. NPDC015120 TaxID=3364023 RepID=UPI0036F46F7A
MSIQISATGPLDGEVLAQKVCDLLGVFNSVPQFIASADWEIEILDDEDDDESEGWTIECYPSDGLSPEEISRVISAIEGFIAESGGLKTSTHRDV